LSSVFFRYGENKAVVLAECERFAKPTLDCAHPAAGFALATAGALASLRLPAANAPAFAGAQQA